MSKTILMKVTSRERPKQLLETVKSYIEMAANTSDMVWLFSFDSNDESYFNNVFILDLERLLGLTEHTDVKVYGYTSVLNYSNCAIVFGTSSGKINAINRDIKYYGCSWDILLNISDDQRPIVKGYDNIIRNAMPEHLDASLWFWDGVQPRISTMEILGKTYYQRFNYIYYPEYKSFFCDNESTLVAQKLGKQIKSNNCIIKHEHYAAPNGSMKFDDLYKKNNTFWKHDEDLYHSRVKINFGL